MTHNPLMMADCFHPLEEYVGHVAITFDGHRLSCNCAVGCNHTLPVVLGTDAPA